MATPFCDVRSTMLKAATTMMKKIISPMASFSSWRALKRFAFWALAAGVLLPVAALFLEVGRAPARRQGRLSWLLIGGSALKLLALLIGGVMGVYGVQIIDPRPASVIVMCGRIVGEAVVLGVLVGLARDLFRRPDPGDRPAE